VHRDVSPGNVMLLWSGVVKILDFGIAKAASQARPAADAEGRPRLAGHLAYLSPEQIRGADVDRRADVFSLGVLLWEMLTGRRLFAGRDEYETMHNVLLQPLGPRLAAEIPSVMRAILERALEREPAHRTPTAGELADDLDGVLSDTTLPGLGPQADVRSLLADLFDQSSSARSVSTSR
jgi:serine/threonine protein kinase